MSYTNQSLYAPTVPTVAKITTNAMANATPLPPKMAATTSEQIREMKTKANMPRHYSPR